MYWSYLTNTNNHYGNNLLTFESNDNLNKLSIGYCELVIDNFFSSFSNDYDSIFISEYDPNQNPFSKEFIFFIKFNDVDKARFLIKNQNPSSTEIRFFIKFNDVDKARKILNNN